MKKQAATFRKSERLCSEKAVSELFARGRSLNVPSLRAVYIFRPQEEGIMPVKVLITVPKRHFRKAVERNLIRRRIREAWRKNKEPLITVMRESGRYAEIALVWTGSTIREWEHVENSVKEVIRRVAAMKY